MRRFHLQEPPVIATFCTDSHISHFSIMNTLKHPKMIINPTICVCFKFKNEKQNIYKIARTI